MRLLQVSASVSGVLVPPSYSAPQESENGELPTWFGYPSEKRNVGCYLTSSTVIGRIVPNQTQLEAILVVDQNDIEFVSRGQEVELFIDTVPWKTIDAVVGSISTTKLKSLPKSLSSRFGGDVIVSQNSRGEEAPQSASFQVSVPFDDQQRIVLDGCTGHAKIRSGTRTVGNRIWRLVQQTFRFDL